MAKIYPLWVAQYPNYEETGFLSEPWTDGWDFGAWSSPLIFQYTGTGRIPGYGGHLDLDLFYGMKIQTAFLGSLMAHSSVPALRRAFTQRAYSPTSTRSW